MPSWTSFSGWLIEMAVKVGFVGIGTMGLPISRHLLGAGHEMVVFDVDAAQSAPIVDAGATKEPSPRAVAETADVVFLSLPGPAEVDAVVRGDDGLLAAENGAAAVVDLSTNSVSMVRALADACDKRNVSFLDAPVSGGAVGAEQATLTVMVGGDEQTCAQVRPLLDCFAETVAYVGPSGAGTLAKLVNNQIFLCASVLIQEGFVMAAKAGMDTGQLLDIVGKSSAGMYLRLAPLLFGRRFDEVMFKLAIAEKDVGVALESAHDLGVEMPMTVAARGVYQDALAMGLGDEVFYATLKVLEAKAGVAVPPPRRDNSDG